MRDKVQTDESCIKDIGKITIRLQFLDVHIHYMGVGNKLKVGGGGQLKVGGGGAKPKEESKPQF